MNIVHRDDLMSGFATIYIDKAKDLGNYGKKGKEADLQFVWQERKYYEHDQTGKRVGARKFWV